jgi:uncharacterized protein (TIGR02266 family)
LVFETGFRGINSGNSGELRAVGERNMASGRKGWDIPQESRRIAHPQKILLRFSSSEKSVEEYLMDLSMTGMFVRCAEPPPPGTRFKFRMQLTAGQPAAQGEGEVVWVREQQQRLSHPRGMGVRFTHLDPVSREQIRATVERYTSGQDGPEELDKLRSVVEETLGEVLDPTGDPAGGTPVSRPSPSATVAASAFPSTATAQDRSGLAGSGLAGSGLAGSGLAGPALGRPALGRTPRTAVGHGRGVAVSRASRGPRRWIAAVLLAAALVAAAWSWLRSREAAPSPPSASPAAESRGESVAQPEAGPPSETLPGAPADMASESPAPEPDPEARIRESLDAWAVAWASQEVDAYLGFYSAAFEPPGGQARGVWRRERRLRLLRPRHIGLEIRQVRVEPSGDGRYRVVFEQTYRSESFEDTVTKSMEWVFEGGVWKIVAEDTA